ncbi:hypothetical protein KsCSTR_42600 [Candidatus Kuenenia stuttgartiensis]|uniref:Uncharacterized protein n=1 Tax=Kuenenia stuttgartiensis TaxID=174633 RepID=A0A6G7GWJ7_KUEST|nr:hypothetical protein KsCSTR_42600 [Candidatus Kuenenia stuttgartiensis]
MYLAHVTRFPPTFRIKNLPHTSVKTLENAREIAFDAGPFFPM